MIMNKTRARNLKNKGQDLDAKIEIAEKRLEEAQERLAYFKQKYVTTAERLYLDMIEQEQDTIKRLTEAIGEALLERKPRKRNDNEPDINQQKLITVIGKMIRDIDVSLFDDIPRFYAAGVIQEIIEKLGGDVQALILIKRFIENEITPREVSAAIEMQLSKKGGLK